MSTKLIKTDKPAAKKMPKGARVTNKSERVEIEEIENGFLITKCTDLSYVYPIDDGKEENGYSYETRKWYSKDYPLEIKVGTDADKSLADAFE